MVLLGCVFVAMIGYGVALTVLPLYTERIHDLSKASKGLVAFHAGLLTSVYALAQLVTGPAAGWAADRIGRRPLLLVGLAGVAASQAPFGFISSLGWLYVLRITGGLATSLLTVAATAMVADLTREEDRVRGMGWFGAAVSLGVVAGPLLGGALNRAGTTHVAGLRIDGYSLPFLAAAGLALAALVAALVFVPDTWERTAPDQRDPGWRWQVGRAGPLLGLVGAAQFGLSLFEGTFVLYARSRYAFDAAQTTAAFLICGAVMAALQLAVVGPLARLVRPTIQASAGFVLMGVGVGGLILVRSFAAVLVCIAVLAAGTALVVPSLSALVVNSQSQQHFAAALGLKSSAASTGQFLGPLIGGALLAWQASSPYLLAAATLTLLGFLTVGPVQSRLAASPSVPHKPPQRPAP